MTIFLVIVFFVQIGLIIFMRYKMLSERSEFQSKLKPLEEFIIELNNEHQKQSLQLEMSEDLKVKMKEINTILNKNIFELNYQLMEDLYPKKEV